MHLSPCSIYLLSSMVYIIWTGRKQRKCFAFVTLKKYFIFPPCYDVRNMLRVKENMTFVSCLLILPIPLPHYNCIVFLDRVLRLNKLSCKLVFVLAIAGRLLNIMPTNVIYFNCISGLNLIKNIDNLHKMIFLNRAYIAYSVYITWFIHIT